MRTQWKRYTLCAWLITALGGLVVACGATPPGDATTLNGTPIVGHALPTPSRRESRSAIVG